MSEFISQVEFDRHIEHTSDKDLFFLEVFHRAVGSLALLQRCINIGEAKGVNISTTISFIALGIAVGYQMGIGVEAGQEVIQ